MDIILAYDIGGSSVRAALVSSDPLSSLRIVRAQIPAEGTRDEIIEVIRSTGDAAVASLPDQDVTGVAVALPGPADYLTGTPWMRHKLCALRGQSLVPALARPGVPVAFVNDATAYALGEVTHGIAAGAERAIVLTLGTGVGSCFLVDGKVVIDGTGVPPGGELWEQRCGGDGAATIEQCVGKAALERWYRDHGGSAPASLEEVAQRAALGERAARELFDYLGDQLAQSLVPWVRDFAAQRVVIGGGVARSAGLFIGRAARGLREAGLTQVQLTGCALGDAAPLVGTAVALRQRLERFGQRSVIYLHGFASSPASHKAQLFVDALHRAGIEVVVPDLNEGDFTGLTVSRQLALVERIAAGRPAGSLLLIGSSLGGYTAAVYAARSPQVAALVLMAPAFDFARRWAQREDPAVMRRWEEEGSMLVPHYGYGRDERIGFGLIADARRLPPQPDVRVPTLILHGQRDDVVDPQLSVDFAAERPNVQLDLLDDDHALSGAAEQVVERAMAFLDPWWR